MQKNQTVPFRRSLIATALLVAVSGSAHAVLLTDTGSLSNNILGGAANWGTIITSNPDNVGLGEGFTVLQGGVPIIASSNFTGAPGAFVNMGVGNNTVLTQEGTGVVISSDITGTTSINASINSATNLNTGTSTGVVTIGNALNTTNLNSSINNVGVNAYATTNNIGNGAAISTNNIGNNAAFASTNVVGNINVGTTVTARGGNTTLSLANNTASLTAGAALATNGITGTTSGTGSGGLTVYNTAQTIAAGSTIPTALLPTGILAGKTYQNKINGNLLVDGNVYINGTLDYVSSTSANTTVTGAAAASSNIAGATVATTGGTAIVMKGSTGNQTVSDANGKLTNVVAPATQSSASLTLTNGLGNTHGILVTETQTVISGGSKSTSLTFDNNDVTFRNAQTGAPIQVHGVNNGTSDYDAVNVRQFAGAVASVSAMANIPNVDQGKSFSMGAGYGNFMGKSALAVGGTFRVSDRTVLRASFAGSSGTGSRTAYGVGAAMSW